MPYEFYKIIHILMVVLMFVGLSLSLFDVKSKPMKIISGISTLLLFVSGMGLVARIGIKHGSMWPYWLLFKVGAFFVIGVGAPIVAKRVPKLKMAMFVTMFVLLPAVVYMVNYKPGA